MLQFFIIDNKSLQHLQDMGFQREDCIEAMIFSNYDISKAALWLTSNAQVPVVEEPKEPSISGYEVFTFTLKQKNDGNK